MKTVIFDIGNVLVVSDRKNIVRSFSKLSGKSEEKVTNLIFLNDDLVTRPGLGQIDSDEFLEVVMNKLEIDSSRKSDVIKTWKSGVTEQISKMIEFISGIKGKYKLVAASDNEKLHFERSLELAPILKEFDKIYLSHEIGMKKDIHKEKLFEYILKDLGEDPENCLFIDDLPQNVEYAKNIGMNGAVFDGTFSEIEDSLFFDVPIDIPFPKKNIYAGALIINSENEIVLSKRKDDSLISPGLLSFFGGMVDKEESLEVALIRELKEELDLNLDSSRLIPLEVFYKEEPRITLPYFKRLSKCFVYVLKLKPGEKINLKDPSSQGVEIVKQSKNEISKLNLTKITQLSIEVYLQRAE